MFGNSYMVPEEFKELATGISLTGIDDDELGSMLMQSSRAVDSYCNTAFGLNIVDMEQQKWNENRRIYPQNQPVIALRDLRLLIGSRQHATISLRDIFVNRTANYVEVVSLAATTSLTAELISLGLTEIIAQYSYIFGTGEHVDSTADTAEAIAAVSATTGIDSFDVTDGTRFRVDDIIRVDAEEMLVQSVVTNTLTVLRGINHREDTHGSGADVYRLASAPPDNVKIATAIIAAARIAARRAAEEGIMGVRSFMIGSYTVTYGTPVELTGGSGFPFVPPEAARLLDEYRVITVR